MHNDKYIFQGIRIEEQLTAVDDKIQEEKRKKSSVKGSANSQLTVVINTDSTASIRFQLTYGKP